MVKYPLWMQKLLLRATIALRAIVARRQTGVEFYLYPTVGTVLIHSVTPELTE